ncbi:MAG: NAD(P)H-binding protein [Erysipelotrichaceae bacterium]
MKILAITGVTGPKSGSAFLRQVIEHIDEVKEMFPDGIKILVRNTSKLNGIDKQLYKCEVCEGNLDDEKYLNSALKDVDTIVHIASIKMSKKICKHASLNDVRRLILVHTTGIYSKYKEAGEEYRLIDDYCYRTCKENKIALTILRPTMIYGNIKDNNIIKFVKMVDKLPIMPVVNGARYKLQPVHYEDLADAYYKVLLNETLTANNDFDLSGGNEVELRDILIEIANNSGKKIHFINIPFNIAYFGANVLFYGSFKKKDYREKVQRLCEPRCYSHDDAMKVFGYNPRTFAEGIKAEVKEYIKEVL